MFVPSSALERFLSAYLVLFEIKCDKTNKVDCTEREGREDTGHFVYRLS
jgi:hypothetical protein